MSTKKRLPSIRSRNTSITTKTPASKANAQWSSPVVERNNNNKSSSGNRKVMPTIPPMVVKLKKFQPQKISEVESKEPPAVTVVPLPEFTLVQKCEEVPPYTVLDMPVEQECTPGPILGAHYSESEQILLVVAEKKVSFFRHHATVALFQKVVPPAKNGTIPSKPRPMWSQIDSVDRMNRDEPVHEFMFSKRIMARGESESASVVYVELRAQPLLKDKDYRTGEMCATYVNIYYLTVSPTTGDADDLVIEVKSIALDTIVALPQEISYTVVPDHGSFVMCWTERVQVERRRVGICKYKLSRDFSSLAAVEEFQSVDGELNGLRWDAPNYVIGTGNQQISIWDMNSGLLMTNIVLTDFELGDTIHAAVLNVARHEKHLLLVQYWQNYLNVVHVNLLDFAYRVLKSREVGCGKEAVQSVARVEAGDGANVLLGVVVRGKGEVPSELLEIFDALTNRLVVMQRRHGLEREVNGCCTRLFLNDKYLIKLGDQLTAESISIQPVNEFLFNLI